MSLLSTKYRSGTKVVHQLFTSSGTWTKPSKFIEGTLVLSGIGGGASGNKISSGSVCGGNGGEFVVDKYVDVTGTSSVSVTIGAGGAAVTGTAPLAGNSGSPTTFGALLTLSGGIGASSGSVQGISVGGSVGGMDAAGAIGQYMLPLPIHCTYAGTCGFNTTSGDYVYVISGSTASAIGVAGGGNGLVLDGTGVMGGSSSATQGGVGYGAGGAASVSANSGAGVQGALYLTWQEYV